MQRHRRGMLRAEKAEEGVRGSELVGRPPVAQVAGENGERVEETAIGAGPEQQERGRYQDDR